jgi:hypothetical protein
MANNAAQRAIVESVESDMEESSLEFAVNDIDAGDESDEALNESLIDDSSELTFEEKGAVELAELITAIDSVDAKTSFESAWAGFDLEEEIKKVSALQKQGKSDIATIKARVHRAELTLVFYALEKYRVFGKSTALRDVVGGMGVSGTFRVALKTIIPNLHGITKRDGLTLDKDKTPAYLTDPESGKLSPLFDMAARNVLCRAFNDMKGNATDPTLSDEWKDTFKSPEKSNGEIAAAFQSAAMSYVKKGMTIQMQMAALQKILSDSQS